MTPMQPTKERLSRRDVIRAGTAALAAGAATMVFGNTVTAALQRTRSRIKDIQTMMMQGGRTYTLVRIITDDGRYGIGEAYGSPGVSVADQILSIKPQLVGKNPHEIDVIYTNLGRGATSLSGTRTDGSAHNLMRAASGIDMALWDLAGKLLDTPTSDLLGGSFASRSERTVRRARATPGTRLRAANGPPRSGNIRAASRPARSASFARTASGRRPPRRAAAGAGAPECGGGGGGRGGRRTRRGAAAAGRSGAGRAAEGAPRYADNAKDSGNRHLDDDGAPAASARPSKTSARRLAGSTTSCAIATGSSTSPRRSSSPGSWSP